MMLGLRSSDVSSTITDRVSNPKPHLSVMVRSETLTISIITGHGIHRRRRGRP